MLTLGIRITIEARRVPAVISAAGTARVLLTG